MKWYDSLYIGDSVKNPRRIKWKINHNAGTVNIYAITFASNKSNLLDIIPSWNLMQRGYPGKKELEIVGLARGSDEAMELVRRIVEETYHNTGGTDVRAYLTESARKRRGRRSE